MLLVTPSRRALIAVVMLALTAVSASAQTNPPAASQPKLRFVESNGIRMRVAEMGTGPLVILIHGWPESWYSWRHQLPALAEAGYRVAAPDVRGYGGSDKPHPVEA